MKNTPGKEECYAHISQKPGIKKCPSCTKHACCFLNSAVAWLSQVCVKMGNYSHPGMDFFKCFKQKLGAKIKIQLSPWKKSHGIAWSVFHCPLLNTTSALIKSVIVIKNRKTVLRHFNPTKGWKVMATLEPEEIVPSSREMSVKTRAPKKLAMTNCTSTFAGQNEQSLLETFEWCWEHCSKKLLYRQST